MLLPSPPGSARGGCPRRCNRCPKAVPACRQGSWAHFLLVLEGLGGAAEVHRIAAVFLFAEDVRHSGRTPVVGHSRRLTAIPADIAPMLRRRRYLASFQPFGDLRRAEAVHAPREDLPHGLCRSFINDPAVLALRVFQMIYALRLPKEAYRPRRIFSGVHRSSSVSSLVKCSYWGKRIFQCLPVKSVIYPFRRR